MVTIGELWQAVAVATVLTFLLGAVLHMMVPLHAKDFAPLPDEAGTLARLRDASLPPGAYLFPAPASPKDMGTPEFKAKVERGPVGIMFLRRPGPFSMGPSLGLQLGYHALISLMVAYLAGRTFGPGADYLRVFQVAGTAATLAYSTGALPFAIWYRPPARFVVTQLIDGVTWGLITAGAFGWLWPR